MHRKLFLFFVQCTVFLNEYNFVYSKAFVGHGIRVVEENEFSSVVCIKKGYFNNNRQYLEGVRCTGTLITQNHVLTAAHCLVDISETIIIIIYGSVDIRLGTRLPPMWWISYDQWATYTNIEIVHRTNDVSVLRLLTSVPDRISPILICPLASSRLLGLETTAVGCGYSEPPEFPTNIEAVDNLRIISNRECRRRANNILNIHYPIPNKDLCTVREPFAYLSKGDSGGPLLYGNYIVAVNSGVHPDCYGHIIDGQSNIHTSVDFYRHYIESMISM